MMKVLVLDNYDSFTYNLVHALRELGADPFVARNDRISVSDAADFERIVLSPGPGIPSEAGIMPELLKAIGSKHAVLGVCLGHQAIGEAFGGTLRNLAEPVHGRARQTRVVRPKDPMFDGMSETFMTGRYHSWVIDRNDFPRDLEILAEDEDGEIMALRHRTLAIHGVQFHPESILTPEGPVMLRKWLETTR